MSLHQVMLICLTSSLLQIGVNASHLATRRKIHPRISVMTNTFRTGCVQQVYRRSQSCTVEMTLKTCPKEHIASSLASVRHKLSPSPSVCLSVIRLSRPSVQGNEILCHFHCFVDRRQESFPRMGVRRRRQCVCPSCHPRYRTTPHQTKVRSHSHIFSCSLLHVFYRRLGDMSLLSWNR